MSATETNQKRAFRNSKKLVIDGDRVFFKYYPFCTDDSPLSIQLLPTGLFRLVIGNMIYTDYALCDLEVILFEWAASEGYKF